VRKNIFYIAIYQTVLTPFFEKMKDLNRANSFYEGNVAKKCEKPTKNLHLSFTSYTQVTQL